MSAVGSTSVSICERFPNSRPGAAFRKAKVLFSSDGHRRNVLTRLLLESGEVGVKDNSGTSLPSTGSKLESIRSSRVKTEDNCKSVLNVEGEEFGVSIPQQQ